MTPAAMRNPLSSDALPMPFPPALFVPSNGKLSIGHACVAYICQQARHHVMNVHALYPDPAVPGLHIRGLCNIRHGGNSGTHNALWCLCRTTTLQYK